MKELVIAITLLLLAGIAGAADTYRVLDKNQNVEAYIKSDGRIFDRDWKVKGHIKDGYVFDARWQRVGKVVPDKK